MTMTMMLTRVGTVELTGTITKPELRLRVPLDAPLPLDASRTYQGWVKGLSDRAYDRATRSWTITGLGTERPSEELAKLGLWIDYPQNGPLVGYSLEDLTAPMARHAPDGFGLHVRPRLLGKDLAGDLLGWGAVWNKDEEWFELPHMDATVRGTLRPGVVWPADTLEKSLAARAPLPVTGFEAFAAALGSAPDYAALGGKEALQEWLAFIPDWFGMDLFEYQALGVLSIALGHRLLADDMGLGKTAQCLAVAAVLGAGRMLVTSPSVVTGAWRAETDKTGILRHGAMDGGEVLVINPKKVKRDKPLTLPAKGIVVVPDSTLVARPELVEQLRAWSPDLFIYDEAHRAKTLGAKRGTATLKLAASSALSVPSTGTPIFASPSEVVPLLEMVGMLGPLFGSRDEFLKRYCTQDPFGRFRPRRGALEDLGNQLRAHVWVRRMKTDVLKQLPGKFRNAVALEVPLAEYRRAHKDIAEKIQEWIDKVVSEMGEAPTDEMVTEYSKGVIRFVSKLRVAAGLTKVDAAAEYVRLHDTAPDEDGLHTRPLIVWFWHKEVGASLRESFAKDGRAFAVIDADTKFESKDQIVADFQAGSTAILLASIPVANAGITLTRAQDMVFAEQDWTPAILSQCEDRAHRIGQTENVLITSLIALGTLDEHIQRALEKKGHTLGAVYQQDSNIAVLDNSNDDLMSAADVIQQMVDELIAKQRRKPRARAAA